MAALIRLTAHRASGPSFSAASRAFTVSATMKKDLVQDLYLNQLKNYKPAPQAKDAAASHVRNYTAPSPPKAPALPTDLAAELSIFDAEEPIIGSTATSTSKSGGEEGGEGAAEYLAFLEQDIPKKEAHH